MLGILGEGEHGIGAVGLAPIFCEGVEVLAGEQGLDAAGISGGDNAVLEGKEIHGDPPFRSEPSDGVFDEISNQLFEIVADFERADGFRDMSGLPERLNQAEDNAVGNVSALPEILRFFREHIQHGLGAHFFVSEMDLVNCPGNGVLDTALESGTGDCFDCRGRDSRELFLELGFDEHGDSSLCDMIFSHYIESEGHRELE